MRRCSLPIPRPSKPWVREPGACPEGGAIGDILLGPQLQTAPADLVDALQRQVSSITSLGSVNVDGSAHKCRLVLRLDGLAKAVAQSGGTMEVLGLPSHGRREGLWVLSVAASPLSVSELSWQACPVCFRATMKSHNLTMREIVDLTGLADLLDLTRREANELACEENFPAPLDIVQGSQIWYGDDVRNWARESGRLI
jgi:hypothetical protein